jgi:hypothetical protein
MTAQWKKFTGSKEQFHEMRNAKNGFIYRDSIGRESKIINISDDWEKELRFSQACEELFIKEYLICQPLPHAEMIARHAMTGQPVYFEYDGEWLPVEGDERGNPFWHPDDEFSFNPLPKTMTTDEESKGL